MRLEGVHTISVGDLLDRYARALEAVVQTDGHAGFVVLHFRPALSGALSWDEACQLLELNGVGVTPHCDDPPDLGHTIRAFTLGCYTGKEGHQPLSDPIQDTWFTTVIRLAETPADPAAIVRHLREESLASSRRGRVLGFRYLPLARTVLLVGDHEEVDRVRATLR